MIFRLYNFSSAFCQKYKKKNEIEKENAIQCCCFFYSISIESLSARAPSIFSFNSVCTFVFIAFAIKSWRSYSIYLFPTVFSFSSSFLFISFCFLSLCLVCMCVSFMQDAIVKAFNKVKRTSTHEIRIVRLFGASNCSLQIIKFSITLELTSIKILRILSSFGIKFAFEISLPPNIMNNFRGFNHEYQLKTSMVEMNYFICQN